MSFQGSSHITIEGGTFTYVAGDQHNHYHENIQYVAQEERKPTVWDEYHKVPTWKVYLKRTIGETMVKRDLMEDWSRLEARRTISIARIHETDKDLEFIHVGYSGQDAFEAFQRDFEQFSLVKNANVAQLFGYNNNQAGVPALIFYDALVPVAHIFERNRFSSLLYTYFNFQFGAALIPGKNVTINDLWIHPSTGELRKGPYVRDSSPRIFGFTADPVPSSGTLQALLPLQSLNDSGVVFSYLVQILNASDILRGICRSSSLTVELVADEEALFMLQSLPGAIYSRGQRDIIGRWLERTESWHYGLWGAWEVRGAPEAMRASKIVLDDGSVRFTVTPLDIHHLQALWLRYGLFPGADWNIFADAWLSQAHRVFSQTRIQVDQYDEYSNLRGFWLGFDVERVARAPNENTLYLFIRPIPRPSDEETIWESWMNGRKYFWSFDSSGHEEISEDVRVSLGLPSFTSSVKIAHTWWDLGAYDAIRQLHVFNGFSPTTTDLTQSLHFPVLQVVGDEHRFEEIGGENTTLDGTKKRQESWKVLKNVLNGVFKKPRKSSTKRA
ncbi:hypothetical protein Moror_3109 [Moniliophthora roreri MCA 2997]|uniref:Uncharacterized protein n=1 Tax=Moniliophthora roreri (strain MCA 2997) TaxID=1381753 RepID=V2X771_MONRO|nr:hypothetical protein Moror_3109 [Moniliophthora roreri MCA 2997]